MTYSHGISGQVWASWLTTVLSKLRKTKRLLYGELDGIDLSAQLQGATF